MTTVKRSLRTLALLLLCVLLTACGTANDKNSDNGELERLTNLLANEEPPSAYRLIVSSDCSAELLNAAYRTATAIAEKTEVPAYVTYETEARATGYKEVWILIGNLQFAVSRESMKLLRRDDYLCRVAPSGDLMIGGRSDRASVLALERFCEEILPAATSSSLLHAEGGFSFEGSYEIEAVTLNGFDLREYCIVYGEDDSSSARSMAYALRDRISEVGGYCLDIFSERSFNEAGRAIILRMESNVNESSNAYWSPTSNGISLCATESLGLSVAVRDFCSRLLSKTSSNTCDCTVLSRQTVLYDASPYTLASLAIGHLLPFSSAQSVTAVTDLLWTRSPDGILVSPMEKKQADYIRQSMSAYEAIETVRDGQYATGLYVDGVNMTLTASYELGASGLTVMNYRVEHIGKEHGAFGLVCIQGKLIASCEVSLPELLIGFREPTVIVAHWQESGERLILTDGESAGLCMAESESFSVSDMQYGFSCYFDPSFLSVQISHTDNRYGYREFSVRPVSVL